MATDNEAKKIVKNLKKNFEKYKNKGNWTQDALSQEAKLAYHTIAKIESGASEGIAADCLSRRSLCGDDPVGNTAKDS